MFSNTSLPRKKRTTCSNKNKLFLFFLAVVLMAGFTLVSEVRPASAAGTLNTCTSFNLIVAMSGGGLVKFNCNGVIYFGGTFPVSGNVTLDASGHNVTLSGPQLFNILPGGSLTLKNITLTNQGLPKNYQQKGGIIINSGKLITNGVTFKDSRVYTAGGAIYNLGTADISGSAFKNNQASDSGGAIANMGGILNLSGTTFEHNQAGKNGGAVYSKGGSLNISYSVFTANKATYYLSEGGAVYNDQESKLTSDGATFESNTVNNGRGGALSTYGPTFLNNSVFKWNGDQYLFQGGGTDGGAIYTKSPAFKVEYANFQANYATRGGAIFNANSAIISKVTVNYNSATNGGGFYNEGGDGNSVRVLNSTFVSNQVSQQGGAIYGYQGAITIINSTISGNMAYGSASAGASIYSNGIPVYLFNSILNTPQGGKNCAGSPVMDLGDNIQFPGASCGQGIQSVNPLLAPLAYNGGVYSYMTMALLPGSPAINHGNNFVCTALPMDGKDGRGLSRTTSGNCDIGAYEVQPVVPGQAPGQK